MTEQEIIDLGNSAEAVLQDKAFMHVARVIADDIGDDILNTGISERDKREDLYLTYHGLRDFLGRMKTFRDRRDNILEDRAAEDHHDSQSRSDMLDLEV